MECEGLERWRCIKGYPDYIISNHGRIKRVVEFRKHKAGLILKPCHGSNGYDHVTLCADGVQRQFDIHRLVLFAFTGPPPKGYIVNHKDLNKRNNHHSNLEWVTRSQNSIHFKENTDWVSPAIKYKERMLRGEKHPMSKVTWEQVQIIRKNDGPSRILAAAYGVSRTTIIRIRSGKIWKDKE